MVPLCAACAVSLTTSRKKRPYCMWSVLTAFHSCPTFLSPTFGKNYIKYSPSAIRTNSLHRWIEDTLFSSTTNYRKLHWSTLGLGESSLEHPRCENRLQSPVNTRVVPKVASQLSSQFSSYLSSSQLSIDFVWHLLYRYMPIGSLED